MKFVVACLMFLTIAGYTPGQSVQGVPAHSCSSQGPPGIPGRDGRDGTPGRDCPCGTNDAEIGELQSNYQELRQQNDVLEQRLSALENKTETTPIPCTGGKPYNM
ncbi:uncharacterized protein [Branchiostoma lanceolatum]|uniref:uncharacterized protein n=1 Tax=Branchiostoma lanceolatum TaxID=7740 RepID=UPI0034537893